MPFTSLTMRVAVRQEFVLEGIAVRRHAVGRGDGAQRADVIVGAPVAHHADRAHRQQHGEGLPDLVVETGLADLVEVDGVGLAQDVELLACDLAGDADGEARAWKRMAADEALGQAELSAQRADLVLEQFAQGFHELHAHALGQAADIVMRLDRDRRAAGRRHAFDDVGIERALRQEFGAAHLCRFLLEHLDEGRADDLALALGVARRLRARQEHVARHRRGRAGYCSGRGTASTTSSASPGAHQAGVDEDAGELVADGLVDQDGRDREIDAAGESADHPALADLLADPLHLFRAERFHVPVGGNAGDTRHEIREQRGAARRVHDLGMEHQAVDSSRVVVRDDREGCVRAVADDSEPGRQAR